jgi:regulator of cell morphogenesis and NO signaling
MTTIDSAHTLGDLVTAHPGAAAVFQWLGIDYCCHGRRSLVEAATAAGVDPDEVLEEILSSAATIDDSARPGEDLRLLSPTELTEHVELSAKIAAVHGDRHPELHALAQTVVELHDDMEPHMAKEEMILFPLIRSLDTGADDSDGIAHCGSAQHPIAQMMREHEMTGEILGRIRALTDDFTVPADACGSYVATFEGLERVEKDTFTHIHKENNVLFPAALALT